MIEWDLEQQHQLKLLAARRRQYRELEPTLTPDDRLDDLGWEIFDFAAMHGASAQEALRQAMNGRFKERVRVRDDFVTRHRLRSMHTWKQLYGDDRAPLFDADAMEHVAFWKRHFNRPNFTYFIQEGSHGPIKIGRSVDVVKRLATFQTANSHDLFVRAVIPSDLALERSLHERFHEARIPGREWFRGRLVAAVLAFGQGLAEQAVHGFDPRNPNSLPHVFGNQVRGAGDVALIRRAIALRLTGGTGNIVDRIAMTNGEFYAHLDAMARDPAFAELSDASAILRPRPACLGSIDDARRWHERLAERADVPIWSQPVNTYADNVRVFSPRRQRRGGQPFHRV